jgi:hypothetical protein
MIEVQRTSNGKPMAFDVTVRDERGESRHHVTMDRDIVARLTGGHTPEQCLVAAFRFLLDRESKESILQRFDVSVIPRYFPEFEAQLAEYLDRS